MLQYNSWNITAYVYNSCSAESATVTVKSGSVKQSSSRPRSSSGGCWTHHIDTNPSQPDCMALMRWPLNISPSCGQWGLVVNVVWTGGDVGTGPNAETAVWKKYSWKRTRQFTVQLVACWQEATRGAPSPTLQPIASRVCRTTMVASVATATTLVSSRTTGQKVSTNTEPEIRMAITISVQCNHSNGIIHRTCRGRDYKWGLW